MSEDDEYERRRKQPPRIAALVMAAIALGLFGYAAVSQRWLYHPKTVLEATDGDAKGIRMGPAHEIGFGLRDMFTCVDSMACSHASNGAFLDEWRGQVLVLRYANGEPVEDQLRALGGDPLFATAERERARAAEDPMMAQLANARLQLGAQMLVVKPAFAPLGWVTFVLLLIGGLALAVSAGFALARRRIAWPVMPTTIALIGLGLAFGTGCVFVAMKPGPSGYIGINFGFLAFGIAAVLGLVSALFLNKLLRPEDPDLLEDAMNPEQF